MEIKRLTKIVYRLVGIFMIVISIMNFKVYAYNPSGHDYNVYMERMKENVINDLPISWVLMKLSCILIGNPDGLYLLSYIMSCLSFFIIMIKAEDDFKYIVLPWLFLRNRGIEYLAGGVLRNVIAFTILTFYIAFRLNNKRLDLVFPIILGLTHIPTLIFYLMYKVINRDNIKETFISFTIISLIVLIMSLTIGKGIGLSLNKIVFIIKYFVGSFSLKKDYGLWWNTIIINMSFVIFSLYIYYRNRDREILTWIVFMVFPLLPILSYHVMLRFIYVSIYPICFLLLKKDFYSSNYRKFYLILLAVLSYRCKII